MRFFRTAERTAWTTLQSLFGASVALGRSMSKCVSVAFVSGQSPVTDLERIRNTV